jgi:DNA-binding phage protein
MKTIARHDEWLMAQLADAEFAAEYLNAASEDDDPKTYLTAMRKVVEARGVWRNLVSNSVSKR